MATLIDYARIASKVYDPSPASIDGWTCPHGYAVDDNSVFEGGSLLSSGFQGRVFKKGGEVVFAYKGTVPSMTSDLVADASLSLNVIPRQAYAALRHTRQWMNHYRNYTMSIVGHSLGGGLAQIVGPQLGIQFVTFNAPGMLEASHGITPLLSGVGRVIRLFGGGQENAGVNYRRSWDLVGNFGAHIGRRVEIQGGNPGPLASHSIDGFIGILERHPDANTDPLA